VSGDPAESVLNADTRARLQNLAYTILSPSLGSRRRTLIAHVAVDRALRSGELTPGASYPVLRERVVRRTLTTGRRRAVLATRAADRSRPNARTEPELAWLLPAARAAYALRHLEGLDRDETLAVLASAGVGDPASATTLADRILTDTRP
jgi:hypothetical protein